MRVLYVDDDPIMTAAVRQMFASEDLQCDTSDLGEAAVDLAKASAYDIILLDVMLPDIDGYEVIKRLRSSGVGTPVLLQSGLIDRENDIDGLWLGAANYLLKPFGKRELFERIQAVLSRTADSAFQDPVRLAEVSSPADEERNRRRRHRRFETVQPGRILSNGGIDCLVLDMSHGGAALQLSNPDADCPESFDLLLQSGATLRCHVRWRSADRVGVEGEALFPDEVVTDILKQGEAAAPEESVPSPPETAGDAPCADGPAQSPEQSPPPTGSAVEVPSDPAPDHHVLPDQPAPTAPRPAPATSLPRDDPASQVDQPKPPGQTADGGDIEGQVFTVDRGASLVAEACECDELVVDGELQAAARARRLRLGRGGRFVGSAEVEVAEIRGHYEGNLIVTDSLFIFPGATVSGTTRYRQIVIEPGGGLLGQVQLLAREPGDAARHETRPREVTPATPPSTAQA